MTQKFLSRGELTAFILCGGFGTRLRSVVADRPKCLALIGNTPFLGILISQLKEKGIRRFVLGTGHLASMVEAYAGDGSRFGCQIIHSREAAPLGTGGAVKLAENYLSDPFLVLNGDSFVDFNAQMMLETLSSNAAEMCLTLQKVEDAGRYGTVARNPNGRVERFEEKQAGSGPGLINAGVYLMRKQLLDSIPPGQAFSLERDLFPRLAGRSLYGVVAEGDFIDIGIPEDYERAQSLLSPYMPR